MAPTVRKRGTATAKAKGVETEVTTKEARAARDEGFTKTIVKRRNAGEKWQPIADDLGIAVGKAIFLYEKATSGEDEPISFTTDASLQKAVLKARKDGLSWGKIAARTGVGEGKLKRLALEGGLEANHRIGRGGRHPGGESAAAKPKARTRSKAEAKAEPAAKTRVRTRVKK